MLGVRAVAANAEFAARAPDLPADLILRPFEDDARVIARPERSRPHGVRHGSEHRLDVARIDAGAADLDDCGTFRDFQRIDFDEAHRRGERIGACGFRLDAEGGAAG